MGYLAKTNIALGEALAYTRGQRVEADAVKANGWQDLVVGENTKEAAEIKAELTGGDPGDFTSTSAPASKPAAKTEG